MKKEWLLAIVSTLVTLLIAVALIRVYVPGLIGAIPGQAVVKLDRKVPAFYESIFRNKDYASKKFLLNDPYTLVRAKPLMPSMQGMGPNDMLGFRNDRIPNVADIVVIGDSQTYGNNAPYKYNFPSLLEVYNADRYSSVYNMSTGGWGAVQYLYIALKARVFRPRVLIVAFYTGNDPLDSFRLVYGSDLWSALRPDKNLSVDMMPKVSYPVPKSEQWSVSFRDGVKTVFTPKLRLYSNQKNKVTRAGYRIMADAAKHIVDVYQSSQTKVIFTIIPTKELVYYPKLQQENLPLNKFYMQLVANEKSNLDYLKSKINLLKTANYIDLVAPLQKIALTRTQLYPADMNGHPTAFGYAVIAKTLSTGISKLLPKRKKGLLALRTANNKMSYLFVRDGRYWIFSNKSVVKENGWDINAEIPLLDPRTILSLDNMGYIDRVHKSFSKK